MLCIYYKICISVRLGKNVWENLHWVDALNYSSCFLLNLHCLLPALSTYWNLLDTCCLRVVFKCTVLACYTIFQTTFEYHLCKIELFIYLIITLHLWFLCVAAYFKKKIKIFNICTFKNCFASCIICIVQFTTYDMFSIASVKSTLLPWSLCYMFWNFFSMQVLWKLHNMYSVHYAMLDGIYITQMFIKITATLSILRSTVKVESC